MRVRVYEFIKRGIETNLKKFLSKGELQYVKKVISVFLIAVTVICIFSGCQSSKNSKQTTEKQ